MSITTWSKSYKCRSLILTYLVTNHKLQDWITNIIHWMEGFYGFMKIRFWTWCSHMVTICFFNSVCIKLLLVDITNYKLQITGVSNISCSISICWMNASPKPADRKIEITETISSIRTVQAFLTWILHSILCCYDTFIFHIFLLVKQLLMS